MTGIIEYDTKFENYYETLVEAINTGNGDTLKKGLQIYREEFNKIKVCKSINRRINAIKNAIGEDVRTFGSHKETLQSILKTKVPMWRLTKSV